jgi:glycosyltransferase involved in cell wall biosynthesis
MDTTRTGAGRLYDVGALDGLVGSMVCVTVVFPERRLILAPLENLRRTPPKTRNGPFALTSGPPLASIAQMPTAHVPYLLVVGPENHGVTRYSTDLAAALGWAWGSLPASPPERTHAHVTDRIYGATLEEAADHVEALARSTRLTITLHDVPQQSDGTTFTRRVDAYRRFVAAAEGVVVNSHHEASLVEEHLGSSAEDLRVIPLGTSRDYSAHPRELGEPHIPTVLISGFVYPGKGHLEVIQAAAEAAAAGFARPAVIAVGAPSAGHEREAEVLARQASGLGVDFHVTGFLADDEYRRHLTSHGVPVAAHQHISASRSILEWGELGRKVLVAESRYSREMAGLRPGTMTLFGTHELALRLEAAWSQPESTWLAESTPLAPTLADVADDYRDWWRELA